MVMQTVREHEQSLAANTSWLEESMRRLHAQQRMLVRRFEGELKDAHAEIARYVPPHTRTHSCAHISLRPADRRRPRRCLHTPGTGVCWTT